MEKFSGYSKYDAKHWANGDQNSVNLSVEEIRKRFYPDVPVKGEIDTEECLFSNRKIKNKLGFSPVFDWRKQT